MKDLKYLAFKNQCRLNEISHKYMKEAFFKILTEYGFSEEKIKEILNKSCDIVLPGAITNELYKREAEELNLNPKGQEHLDYFDARCPKNHPYNYVINYDTTCDINPFKDQRIYILESINEGYKPDTSRH